MGRHRIPSRGFTLIEILIAMAIFTLIGLAGTSVLTTVIDSNELSEQRFEKLQQLQRTMLTIERDIQQAVPRPIRLNGERTEVVMRGGELDNSDSEGDALGFVRSGWNNPQNMLPRSTLQYVGYRIIDEKLERLYSNYVDNVVGYEPKSRILLEGISEFQVEFIASAEDEQSGNSSDDELNWVDSYAGTVLPEAVAIEFVSQDFGRVRRVFTLRARL